MKLAVLLNPRAGAVRRDPGLAQRLAAILGDAGELFVTDTTPLAELCTRLRDRGVELIASCGGDGTGQATLTELARAFTGLRWPRLALLGGGTVNTILRNLGVRGTPEQVLRRLVDALGRGGPLPTVSQAMIEVDGRRGFLFAAALGARFLERYYEGADPGPARAARLAVQVSGSALIGSALAQRLFRPVSATIAIDDGPSIAIDARLLVASTVPEVGVGMRICPRAGAAPDRFHLVASAQSSSALARQLPAVLAGQALRGPPEQHIDRLAARAELIFDDEEPYTLDGDLFRARTITISHAGTVELVRP
jgi:diacylglycerol kinase (ATP)